MMSSFFSKNTLRVFWIFVFFVVFFQHATSTGLAEPLQMSATQELKLYYSYRSLNQNFESLQSASDFILLGSSNFIATWDTLRFEAKPEIRAISGDNQQLSSNNPNFLQLQSPNRAIETRFHFGDPSTDSTVLYGDWERLNLSYSDETFEFLVGRKPFSLGVMKYLSVWNKFSRPVPGITLIPLYFGSDGATVKLKLGDWVAEASQHIYNFGRDHISTGQLIYYGDFANIHLMIGSWWNQTVGGVALAKDILEGNFTSEVFFYENAIQWGNGYERALNDRFSFALETLYQSDGAIDSLDYTPFLNSHFQIFQASFYSYEVLHFQWTHLLKTSLGGLTNWIDFGTAINLGALYSLSNNVDLGIDALIPAFRQNAEFSNRTFRFNDGTSFGVPLQIVSHLDWTF